MYNKAVKKCFIFVATVVALNLLIVSVFNTPQCEANLVSGLSKQLLGADVNAILQLVIHLKDIKQTLDPIIALLQTLIPILGQVSNVLGLLEKLNVL